MNFIDIKAITECFRTFLTFVRRISSNFANKRVLFGVFFLQMRLNNNHQMGHVS